MANSTREIRRRIRSIGNTKKVTKAMELISSVKMRKAYQALLGTRPYAERAWRLLLSLAKRVDPETHPLLRHTPEPKKIATILIASNRGLVGGFNARMMTMSAEYLKSLHETTPAEVDVVLMGTKGRAIFYQHGHEIAAEFMKSDIMLDAVEVQPLSKLVIDGYRRGDYDRVVVVYTDYVSSLVQQPRVRQILPINPDDFAAGSIGILENGERHDTIAGATDIEYEFEPGIERALDALLPRLVEMQIFRAILETNASEHAARMLAMRNASDAANDLINDLTLSFNQARQAGITQDLSEISASRAALEA